MTGRPAVTIERQVEWPDTDASGHYHHATVIRWVEAAENALHEQLGVAELFGTVPRVHYEVDFLARLWFRDVVQVELVVAHVGRTSVRYEFTVTRGDELGARGTMICVNSRPTEPGSQPWPDKVRTALTA